jgi:hypothetical protein
MRTPASFEYPELCVNLPQRKVPGAFLGVFDRLYPDRKRNLSAKTQNTIRPPQKLLGLLFPIFLVLPLLAELFKNYKSVGLIPGSSKIVNRYSGNTFDVHEML